MAAMAGGERVRELTDETFAGEVGRSALPVLVDFTATWCGPCQRLAPLVAEVADEFEGQIVVAKIDVDENPATAQRYGVRAMPTLLVFVDGEVRSRHVGLVNRKGLLDLLLGALDGDESDDEEGADDEDP
jgi:thioredoxin 1